MLNSKIEKEIKKRKIVPLYSSSNTKSNRSKSNSRFIGNYDEAKKLAQSIGFKNKKEWYLAKSKGGKRPINLHSDPHRFFKDKGWESWGEFLGYKGKKRSLTASISADFSDMSPEQINAIRDQLGKLQENNVSSPEVNSNDDLISINPSNNKNESSEVKAINNFDLAKEKEEEEDFDSAIKFYTKSIQFYDYYPSFMNRGIQNLRRNNIELAIEDFSDVIRIKPDYHVAYYHRAKAFLLEKNIESAKSDFEKVIELKPNNRLAKIELEKIS